MCDIFVSVGPFLEGDCGPGHQQGEAHPEGQGGCGGGHGGGGGRGRSVVGLVAERAAAVAGLLLGGLLARRGPLHLAAGADLLAAL